MKLYMAAALVPRSVQRLLAAIFFVVMAGAAWAQGVLPVPALDGRVIDQTGTLDAAARQSLDAKLAAFEQKKGSQIVVLMVPTTQPEDIASYANRVASTWKIGRKEVGDGVLVIVAKDDRKMRIEVARTLEGAVPDLTAARIIDEQMKPRFRDNDFAGGISAAVDQLVAVIGGEALPEVQRPSAQRSGLGGGGFDWPELGIFLFFGVFVVGRVARSIFGNKLGPVVTGLGAGAIAMVITSSILLAVAAGFIALLFTLFSGAMSLPSMGSGGRRGGGWGGAAGGALGGGLGGGFGGGFGGGSSGGGGGFSSGGGGSFGGGGASGDW